MTSKNLFFKMMRENAKQRLWSVALIALIFFFAFPVQTALSISSFLNPERWAGAKAEALELAEKELIEYFMRWCSISNGVMIFLLILFAVVCGISGFSYLHSRKKTDFFHSIPIQREKLFGVVWLNGLLFVAVPYLAGTLISALMIQIKTGSGVFWGPAMTGFLLHMAFYFLVYATVVAAVILTGNTVVSLLGTLVFFSLGPAIVGLALGYCETYFVTFYNGGSTFERLMMHSSPVAWYISAAANGGVVRMALWAVAAGALILGAALLLYRIRPSEAAGRAMAFKKSQPLIKCLIVVPSALLGSLLFHEMMRQDGWSVFGLVCGLVISYAVIEIIYNFDFKRLFAHKFQLVFCGAAAAVIMVFFRFDLSGYDSYLPSESRLEAGGIHCYRLDADVASQYQAKPELYQNGNYVSIGWSYPSAMKIAEGMRVTDKELILAIGRQGVEDAQAERDEKGRSRNYSSRWEESSEYGNIVVAYHLKNGKTVYRMYTMNMTAVRDPLNRLYSSPGYKEAIYPVLSYQAEDIAGINYQEFGDFRHVNLKNEEMKEKLLTAYQKELSGLTAEVRSTESPIGGIQFKTKQMQEMIDTLRASKGSYTEFNYHLYFPIYPSFTETIGLLGQCGIEVGDTLTADKIEKLVLEYRGAFREDLTEQEITDYPETAAVISREDLAGSVTLTDKKQIKEVLESSVDSDWGATNYLNELYDGIQIFAYVPAGQQPVEEGFGEDEMLQKEYYGQTESAVDMETMENGYQDEYRIYHLSFEYAEVPDFVKEAFHLNDTIMEHNRVRAY